MNLAADLNAWLGENLTTQLVTPDQQAAVHRILAAIGDQEDMHVARAWMIGMNPHLNNQAPLLVIANGRYGEAEAAARAYLAGQWT